MSDNEIKQYCKKCNCDLTSDNKTGYCKNCKSEERKAIRSLLLIGSTILSVILFIPKLFLKK